MKVRKHVNRATIDIDFSDTNSARAALEFIAYHAGLETEQIEAGSLNKISLIKAIRKYGAECVEKSLNGEERPAGLASAKQFVERNLSDWYRRER